MDSSTRSHIQRATQATRGLLEDAFREQLEGTYDILLDGTIAEQPGSHLSDRQIVIREKLVAAVAHKRSTGLKAKEAVDAYLREAAFTTLNRFVALKMLEARDLIQQCVSSSKDELPRGFKEFTALAPGLVAFEDKGYRLYIETLFDEIGQEVKVLFDRRDAASLLWPDRQTLLELLGILNAPELASVWTEDETIGWVYQYFNGDEERTQMRAESQAPRNSHELAVRNQFFTPRYVVQFLTDNTLGRTWYEMMQGQTKLAHLDYLVRRPNEVFLAEGESAPECEADDGELSQEELLQQTVHVPFRAKKDPRDLRILDPACGSGHFLLYTFDLLITIYEEAWGDAGAAAFDETGNQLRADYSSIEELRRAVPELILRHNLHGVDIDPRAAQIAALALWMRAHRAYNQFDVDRAQRPPITKTNIVVAEPMPGDTELVDVFAANLNPSVLGDLFKKMVEEMKHAGELGSLLKIEETIANAVKDAAEVNRQGNLFAGQVESQDFWDATDEKIVAALWRFAESAAGAGGVRRQLFAGDAAQGVAFIELVRKRFDVVVMNPPFGLAPKRVQQQLSDWYPESHADLYAAFCVCARQLAPNGLLGAITSRAFLVNPRHESFRTSVLLPSLRLLLDLGLDVMDAAAVEAAAFVLEFPKASHAHFVAQDLRHISNRAGGILEGDWLPISREAMSKLPGAMVLYSLPSVAQPLLSRATSFEPSVGTAREGMKSFDDLRFVRAWWEVPVDSIGWTERWVPYAKGGGHAYFYHPSLLVINWRNDGIELRALNLRANGSTSQVRQASTYWRRPGLTYSRRSTHFSARILPAEHIFATMGPAILLNDDAGSIPIEFLLGWINSRLIRYLIHLQANKSNYLTGILKRLPWVDPTKVQMERLGNCVETACRQIRLYRARWETDPNFTGPPPSDAFKELVDNIHAEYEHAVEATVRALHASDATVDEIYGGNTDWIGDELRAESAPHTAENSNLPNVARPSDSDVALEAISYALGTALGRWDGRTSNEVTTLIDPFSMPTFGRARRHNSLISPMVDDEGHPADVVSAVESALSSLLPDGVECVSSFSDGSNIRSRLRDRSGLGLWNFHINTHKTGARRAPVYWQLATESCGYSVWCYYNCLTRDTFFGVANDYVAPKVDTKSAS